MPSDCCLMIMTLFYGRIITAISATVYARARLELLAFLVSGQECFRILTIDGALLLIRSVHN